jgi:hypothetical protein
MKFEFYALGLAVAALLLNSQLADGQDNLVINGSFSGNANSWTITNTPGGFGYHSAVGNPPGGVQLDNVFPSPPSDPTASQTISGLTPGVVYLVSGDYRRVKVRGSGLPTDQPSFGVAIDGDFLFTTLDPGFLDWRHFSFPYTASSTTVLLSVSSQLNGTGFSYDIDNIAMQAAPQPPTGNYNGDGTVDAADYVFWRKTSAAGTYEAWRSNFGESISAGGSSVPEPSTAMFTAAVIAIAIIWHRC